MNLPTADEVEELSRRGEEDCTREIAYVLSQLAPLLRSPEIGEVEALENVAVTVINGSRYVPDSAYDRALAVARRLATQLMTARDLPCCDAREEQMGCYRAVHAERVLATARAALAMRVAQVAMLETELGETWAIAHKAQDEL